MIYEIYFSPTGGTKKAADMVASGFGTEIKTVDIFDKDTDLSKLKLTDKDILLVAAPCYGGVAPAPAIDKLKLLKGNGAKAVAIAVYGNRATDDELLQLQNTLNDGGCTVVAGIEALAEHSLARTVATGRPNKDDEKVLKSFAVKIKEAIENNTYSKDLILPGNKPYKEFHGSGTKPVMADECIKCGSCAAECPVNAIPSSDPTKTDYNLCISCMHCVSICPVNARVTDPVKSKSTAEKLTQMAPEPKQNKLFI